MGVSFFEVMRGELRDRWGREHLAEFQIKAEASRLGSFLRSGEAALTGIVHAEPWVSAAPLSGTVQVALRTRREIAYRLHFASDETHFELSGAKSVRLFAPVASMTHMPVRLEREGVEVATGELRFDVNNLLTFLASWFPSSSMQEVALRGPTGPGDVPILSERQLATFAALTAAMVARGERSPAADAQTLTRARELMLSGPSQTVSGYLLALAWIDAVSLLHRRRRFAVLEVEEARGLLSDLVAGEPWPVVGQALPSHLMVRALGAPIKMAHYGRADYLAAIGHPAPRIIREEPAPRSHRRVVEVESLQAETTFEADVVVVGTGAGGAAVAAALAQKGLAVAMLEEGRYARRHNFTGAPLDRVNKLWRGSGMSFTVGAAISIPIGRVVGGTTTINSATSFPTPDSVLEQWREAFGFPDDFAPDVYHRYSERVRQVLQVEPGDPAALGKIAAVLARGADAMGLGHGPLPRNAPGCPGAGECIFGCPEGAKRSADVSWVPMALEAGAELTVGLPVTRILMDGARAVGVEARGTDAFGRSKVVRVRAQRVVLACGSLVTPTLLMDNGFRLPQLGRNLSVHPGLGMVARCTEDLEPWSAIPQGYSVHALEEEGIRYEGFYLPPSVLAGILPTFGRELGRWMDDFPKLAQFGFMTRDRSNGTVRRGPDGQRIVSYRLDQRSIQQLKRGSALLGELFLRAGAREVFTSNRKLPVIRTLRDCERLEATDPAGLDFGLLGAHPLGTCRMGPDPDTAVVDFDHRVYGTTNLHVVDGSVVPSSLGVNPQMTIMAFALRAADLIAEKIVV